MLLTGGHVVDEAGPRRADVLVTGTTIAAVGPGLAFPPSTRRVDCTGRYVVPGFVDSHSHVDGAVFDEDVQLALLRQGITSAIAGQDGVSYAPGDGAYASSYFAAVNGAHPTYRGPGVAELLASYDGATPLNVAYLVPAGTVRHEVMGDADGPASPTQLAAMQQLVREGLADGAVGLSSGLDYTPGLFAGAQEIAALCRPVAEAGLPYVTHMRGGYEDNSAVGVEEAAAISEASGVGIHLSHFHTRADEAWRLMALLKERGIDATFDAYPYTRGCSILGMPLLSPELNAMAPDDAAAALRDPAVRARLRTEWFPERVVRSASLGPAWPEMITIGHAAHPDWAWAHGLTLADIAEQRGTDAIEAALDLLADCRLEVNAIMAVRDQRPVSDLGRLVSHPRHVGGSDGIFIGRHPHPRGRGTFASYLGVYTRETGHLSWADAVGHLSTRPSRLFQLGQRGRVTPGWIADLAVIDPATVGERADYTTPLLPAVGVDDVLVAGEQVLAAGRLTGNTPGRGLRAAPTPSTARSSS